MENNTKNLPAVVNLPCQAEDAQTERRRQEEELCKVEIESLRVELDAAEKISDHGTVWADEQIVDLNIRIERSMTELTEVLQGLTDEEYLEVEKLCGVELGQRVVKKNDDEDDFGDPEFEEDEDWEAEPINREERRAKAKRKKQKDRNTGLRKLYLKVAKRIHPDVFIEGTYGLSAAEASDMFKQASAAYKNGDATILMALAHRLAMEDILDVTNVLDDLLEERNKLRAALTEVCSRTTYKIGELLKQIDERAEQDEAAATQAAYGSPFRNVTGTAFAHNTMRDRQISSLRSQVRHAVMPQVNLAERRNALAQLAVVALKSDNIKERAEAMRELFVTKSNY